MNGPRGGAIMDVAASRLLKQLYRARPFTKAIPFNKTLAGGDPNETVELWVPANSYFEVVRYTIRCTVANTDLALCDTNSSSPFAFVMPSTSEYTEQDITPGYRSQNFANVRLLINNPGAVACQIKGVIYGYEVTREGNYR